MDLATAALFLVTVLLLIYQFVWKGMNYFKHMGIMHKSPLPILGNMAPVLFHRIGMSDYLQKLYNSFPDFKYFGFYMFTTPIIVVRDPEMVSSIAIKNFDNFTDHRGFVDEELDPLMGKNLFALRGDHWREMRKLLSPSFTSSKMKTMFTLINDCAKRFTEHVAAESKNGKIYDLKDIFGRCSTDVIATTNFGIAVDSMKDKDNEFYVFAKESMTITPIRSLKLLLGRNFPNLSKFFKMRVFSSKARKYFTGIIDEAVRTRREKNVHRPDMIHLMMESRDTNGRQLSIDEMTNQAFIFFLGGFDTTSNLMCFAAHEIAANPDVQAKLRAEIEDVMRKTNGKPTYDAVKDMRYMDAVLDETNRLYPAAGFLDRVCVKEFELEPASPDSKPITIKPGGIVWFVPFATQRDPNNFPDPLKFDPDRFLNAEVPQNSYIPFGIGPRICIGNRFALMETKIMLFHLLFRCDIEPCAKTTIPIRFSKKTAALTADNGFWLNFKSASSSNNGAGGINMGPIVGGRRPPSQQSFHSSKNNHPHHSRQQTNSALPSTPRIAGQQPEVAARCIHIRSSSRNLVSTRSQQSITKMLLLISTVFILLNLPSYVIRLCVFFFSLARKDTPDLLWCLQQFFMLLYYTNFSINFLLYAMCGITFRRCLQQLLRKVLKSMTRYHCNPQRYI